MDSTSYQTATRILSLAATLTAGINKIAEYYKKTEDADAFIESLWQWPGLSI
jgi:hypothetical protein